MINISKKHIVLYFSLAMLLVSLAFSVSYAYFTMTITGNENVQETRVVTGILDIDFNITDKITNSNIMLIDDSDREERAEAITFSVSNNGTGNVSGAYLIYLNDLTISDNLKSADFKWELVKNNVTLFEGDFLTASTGNAFPITSMTSASGVVSPLVQTIAVNNTDNFVLRVWLSSTDDDQTGLLGGTFSAKVKMIATQVTSD